MPGVSKINHKGKEVLYVDYSGCNTDMEMIDILHQAKDLVLAESKPYLQLSDFTDCHASSNYMRESRKVAKEVPRLAIKRAVLGVDTPGRKILLYAYNVVLGKENATIPFETKLDALDWLVA